MLKLLRVPFAATAIALAVAVALGGWSIAAVVAILVVLEVSLSFDNAVVNASVLEKMDERWQRIFLTVGVLIAVFGMRLVFPLAVVAIAGQMSPGHVLDLALHHPAQYGQRLHEAHPAIAAFGGIFLLMIFLDFLFEEREITWLGFIERPLAKVGRLDQLSVVVALIVLIAAASTFASTHSHQVLIAGAAGVATYLGVASLAACFENADDEPDSAGGSAVSGIARAGLFSFLYLEVLDASFSFDGVVGAFSVTDKIFVIALGLGVGACYIRGLTVYLVRRGALQEFVHLEHGAHWAIGSLAALLLITISHDVPELVTGVIGVAFIGTALLTSVARNRRATPLEITAHVPAARTAVEGVGAAVSDPTRV